MYLNNDITIDKLNYKYEGIEYIDKSIKLNDKLGTVKVIYDDDVLTTYDVFLNKKIEYYHPFLYGAIGISFVVMLLSLEAIIVRRKKRKKKSKK